MASEMMPIFTSCKNARILQKVTSFRNWKNTLISRWHRVTILTPQLLILPISSPNKCLFLRKYKYFSQFSVCNRIKYPVEKKRINHIILFGITACWELSYWTENCFYILMNWDRLRIAGGWIIIIIGRTAAWIIQPRQRSRRCVLSKENTCRILS